MRWKIFQWMKFLFRHASNSGKLSRQKFHNDLVCVFTAHYASKDADWNQQRLTDGGILAHRNSANHPYCFLSNQKKSSDSGFFACDLWKDCIMPSSRKTDDRDKGRGHDRRLLSPKQVYSINLPPMEWISRQISAYFPHFPSPPPLGFTLVGARFRSAERYGDAISVSLCGACTNLVVQNLRKRLSFSFAMKAIETHTYTVF